MYNNDDIEIEEIKQDNLIYKDKLNEVILTRIKILLKESHLTQTEFFDKIKFPIKRSNASSFFNGKNNSKISILLLQRISNEFNVSLNWLTGNLPEDVRKDSFLSINEHIGLAEENIEILHNLKNGDLAEKKRLIEGSNYPNYKPYIDVINEIINSNFFTIVINDLRLIDLNLKNSNTKSFGYSMSKNGETVQLSCDMARDFLIQKSCDDFRTLIKDINNIKDL